MIDENHGSVDIVVQLFSQIDDDTNDQMECIEKDDEDQSKEKEEQLSILRIPEYQLHARPLYRIQRKDIPMIRQRFQEQQRLLLKTYKSNALYSCTNQEWEMHVSKFFEQTNAYHFIGHLNETNRTTMEKYLDDLVNRMKTMLNHLLEQRLINLNQCEEMKMKHSNVQYDRLYFIPDTRQHEISLQATMISSNNPYMNISRYLYRLLQPVYEGISFETTYMKGSDAILAIERYHKQGHLRSTTLLVTLHVHRILSLFNHDQIIQTVESFLHQHVPSKQIHGISISTMIEFIRFILKHQFFIYNDKFYQQTHGSDSDTPLIGVLVNILLFDWEQPFVTFLKENNEIYGRCFDEIFLTWNQSKNELESFIQTMNQENILIQVEYTASIDVDYLDANISWINDDDDHDGTNKYQLETTVNHSHRAEPYALPYIDDDSSTKNFSKLIRSALIRAVLSCSDVYQFQLEREYIELSFTMNQFSLLFIQKHICSFLREFFIDVFEFRNYRASLYDTLRQRVIDHDRKCRQKKLSLF